MKTKHLWKGIFNFYCEVKREYAYAYTKEQAKVIMARRLAKKQGVMPYVVLAYLKEHTNSYDIKLEVEFTEDDENKEDSTQDCTVVSPKENRQAF